MSNRFEKAIKLKKTKNDNLSVNISEKQIDNSNEIINGNINANANEKAISLKEQLKSIDNNKTQITINVKNENLQKLDRLADETKKSRAYIIDYLLEKYLDM